MGHCSFSFVIPLVALMVIRIPTVMSIVYETCKGGLDTRYCNNYWSTECCSSGFYQSAICCSPRSCHNGYFGYNTCWRYTQSKCCYRTAGSSSSCCNYYDYSRTSSSRYWSKYSKTSGNGIYYAAPIGAIVGGVIGGLVLLILMIVIPVVLCGVCAAGANRHGRTAQQTIVTTQNQVQPTQGAFVNRGYAPPTYGQAVPPLGQGMPQTGAVQPPPYNQAVMFAGPGNTGAPPTAAMYPQPGGQYPPPAAVNPPQTGGQYPPTAPEDANNMKNAPNTRY